MRTSVFYTLIVSLLLIVSTTLFTVFQNMNYLSVDGVDAMSSAARIDLSPVSQMTAGLVGSAAEFSANTIKSSIIEVPVGNELPVLLFFSVLFIAWKFFRHKR